MTYSISRRYNTILILKIFKNILEVYNARDHTFTHHCVLYHYTDILIDLLRSSSFEYLYITLTFHFKIIIDKMLNKHPCNFCGRNMVFKTILNSSQKSQIIDLCNNVFKTAISIYTFIPKHISMINTCRPQNF